MFNEKGDYILYMIITVLLVLIGAIFYYVYTGDGVDYSTSNNSDSNFISEFKSKMPNTNAFSEETYANQYPIKAKLSLDMKIEINDKNISISGEPEFSISERPFVLLDPKISGFTGTIDKTGLTGGAININGDEYNLEIRSQLTTGFNNIKSITIKDIQLNIENSNIIGELDIQNKPHILNKSYLQIKGFSGDLKIVPNDNNSPEIILDGNVGYLKIIDGIEETTLK